MGQPSEPIYPDLESYERHRPRGETAAHVGQVVPGRVAVPQSRRPHPLWCRIYGKAVDPARTDQGTVWVLEDISEARRIAEALHETLREMEALMRNAPVGLVFTRDRHIVRYNPRMAEMFGFDGDKAVGQPARILYRSEAEYAGSVPGRAAAVERPSVPHRAVHAPPGRLRPMGQPDRLPAEPGRPRARARSGSARTAARSSAPSRSCSAPTPSWCSRRTAPRWPTGRRASSSRT